MKYFGLLLLSASLLLAACSGNDKKQFEHAGGTFTFALANEPTTLEARKVTDVYSSVVLSQILEGLVTLNPETLEAQPSLAKGWEISDDGKTITFELRDDVYFHSHELIGDNHKLTPEDVIYSIELACRKQRGEDPSSAYTAIFKGLLKGADAFHEGKAEQIAGLSANGHSITMELVHRDVNFVNKLTQTTAVIVSKELVEAGEEASLIGTGPFKFDKYVEIDGRTNIVLQKNQDYYGTDEKGNQLPYLDSLVFVVEGKSLRQLDMFEQEQILLIDGLPPSRITSMLQGSIDKFNSTPPEMVLRRKPLLRTQYYHFNLTKEEFKDPRVRKAFNYAIDREEIVQNILNNQAYGPGHAGIVPPSAFDGYNSEKVEEMSYSYNPEKAKRLMNIAGYPNGEGFPSISLKFNLGTIHSAVADEVSKQLKKVLNINVNLEGVPFQDKLDDQMNAKGDLFRTSWNADYYSPESFLMNAYGGTVPENDDEPSMMNHARYQNEKFDAAFEKGQSATDIVQRYKHFVNAEKILMEDAPFIILWYEETIKIAHSKVRNLNLNEMNYYSFKNVYLKDWTKEEWQKKMKK